MPRGGACGPKRKRTWDTEYPTFPEERPLQSQRTSLRTVGAAASLSDARLTCGEGFQGTSGNQSLTNEKATTTGKNLKFSRRPRKEAITYNNTTELTDITWSSSGSDLSDEDKILPKSQKDNGHGSKIDRFCNRNILSPEEGASEDELQFIDWEIDSDREDATECNECEDGDGAVEISDCASCASSHSLTSEKSSDLLKQVSAEILEYSSHSEKEDDTENVIFIDSESPHKYDVHLGQDTRQINDTVIDPRMKSTEPILCTPQKQTAKLSRTPEDSAKKKKLLRGGLAERLNGLQNRERSAISLWRHQCVSYQKTLSGRKSGILIVKILELHEECTMQVAMCEQLMGPPSPTPLQGMISVPGAYLRVLFTRETAGYLCGRPQDIILIFPPWQKLIISNGSCPVILNTYFCQKYVAKEDPETTQKVYSQDIHLPRRNTTLAQMFRFKDITDNSPEIQVLHSGLATTSTDWNHGHEEAKRLLIAATSSKDSLLDVVECQGAAPYSKVGVRVVVQRVYFLPGRDSTRGQKGNNSRHADQPGTRVCLLVQDAYGIFGEVHLEGTIRKDRELEGRSCSLMGLKVLQKATRERTPGLFSVLDTVWPPVTPVKAPGHSQPCTEVKTHLPRPAFCYIFSAQTSLEHIAIIEEDRISKLYQPPVFHCLKEVLQTDYLGARCSFYARVLYRRPQLKSLFLLEQREIWLLVTDISLQTKTQNSPRLPRTLPVCVAPSCVLCPEVLEALTMAAPCSIFFKDALRDEGQIVCVERTVLLLQKPLLCVTSGAASCELTGPVELDELDSHTPVNSICSVQGTVVSMDESTEFSWPVCDQCGNRRLEQRLENRGTFSCGDCSRVATAPTLKRHLQVFLNCPARPQCSVKVKLLQHSISSLLRFATCKDGSYDVKSVLGKEVGLFGCFVQSITTHPTGSVALEEIELLGAGAQEERPPWPVDL